MGAAAIEPDLSRVKRDGAVRFSREVSAWEAVIASVLDKRCYTRIVSDRGGCASTQALKAFSARRLERRFGYATPSRCNQDEAVCRLATVGAHALAEPVRAVAVRAVLLREGALTQKRPVSFAELRRVLEVAPLGAGD